MEDAVSIKFQETLRRSVWTDRQTARWRSVPTNTNGITSTPVPCRPNS